MSAKTISVISFIPALAALIHDGYLFYTHMGVNDVIGDATQLVEDRGFHSFFASFGYIWTTYHPDSYSWAVENLDPGMWGMLDYVLTFKAFYVGIVFAILVSVLARLFSSEGSHSSSSPSYVTTSRADQLLGKKKKGMQYKRK